MTTKDSTTPILDRISRLIRRGTNLQGPDLHFTLDCFETMRQLFIASQRRVYLNKATQHVDQLFEQEMAYLAVDNSVDKSNDPGQQ